MSRTRTLGEERIEACGGGGVRLSPRPKPSPNPNPKPLSLTPTLTLRKSSGGGVAALRAKLAAESAKAKEPAAEPAKPSGGGGRGIAALKAKLAAQGSPAPSPTAAAAGGGGGGIAALKARLGGVGVPIPGMGPPRGFALPGLGGAPRPGGGHRRASTTSMPSRGEPLHHSHKTQSVDLTHTVLDRATMAGSRTSTPRQRGKRRGKSRQLFASSSFGELSAPITPIEVPAAGEDSKKKQKLDADTEGGDSSSTAAGKAGSKPQPSP